MVGQIISHYEILDKVGEGEMGLGGTVVDPDVPPTMRVVLNWF